MDAHLQAQRPDGLTLQGGQDRSRLRRNYGSPRQWRGQAFSNSFFSFGRHPRPFADGLHTATPFPTAIISSAA